MYRTRNCIDVCGYIWSWKNSPHVPFDMNRFRGRSVVDPDPYVIEASRIRIRHLYGSGSGSGSRYEKVRIFFYCFVTSVWLLSFKYFHLMLYKLPQWSRRSLHSRENIQQQQFKTWYFFILVSSMYRFSTVIIPKQIKVYIFVLESMGAKNRLAIGLSYLPARLQKPDWISSLEPILRLLKSKIIRALLSLHHPWNPEPSGWTGTGRPERRALEAEWGSVHPPTYFTISGCYVWRCNRISCFFASSFREKNYQTLILCTPHI
jgi:hypothetical protein